MMSEEQKIKDVLCNGIQLKSMKLVPRGAKNKQITSQQLNM